MRGGCWFLFFFSSRRRHTRSLRDWSSDVCSSDLVGIVGYSLGGGMGWYARSHGLATNSVTAVEIVTPDGRLVRADHENEAELFWALRGGGGSFGVVTALEFRLYTISEVYAGVLFFGFERASEVLHA